MKNVIPLALALSCLVLVGCESMSSVGERVSERFSPSTAGVTKLLPGSQAEVHAAARNAAKQIGFRVTKAGAVQGILEAMSGLQSDGGLRSSRQVLLRVRMEQVGEGVQVRVAFSEVIEDEYTKASSMGTETPLVDSPLYGAFFRAMEKQLPQSATQPFTAPATPPVPGGQAN